MSKKNTKLSRVTIYDVARSAGCSIATVSLALRGDKRVNVETSARVLSLAEKLNYQPNYLARSLAKQKTYNIGVIVPDINNPVFSEIISGIEEYISKQNYYLNIGVTYFNLESERHYMEMFSGSRSDGIILLPSRWDAIQEDVLKLKEQGYPLCVSGINPHMEGISYVSANKVDGTYRAVEYLIKNGHKKIAYLSGGITNDIISERFEGYKKALSIYGIEFNANYVIDSEKDFTSIREALKVFLRRYPEVTAIFCKYDFVAMAVIKAASDLELRVPEDLSVLGYDNIKISEYYPVGLTTIDPNSRQIGELSGRILINMIENKEYEPQHMLLTPQLIIRDSVAPAR